jgi:hypothetical protein
VRQVRIFGRVVVRALGEVRHRAVAGVAAEPDALAARGDGPGTPERGVFVERGARRGVLAGEAGDAGCYAVACVEGWGGGGRGGGGDALLAGGIGRKGYIDVLPPVEFDGIVDAAFLKPLGWESACISRDVGSIALAFLSPNGTANNTFGCVFWIFRMLGWERWS